MLKQLSIEEAMSYKVPADVSENRDNIFIGQERNPIDLDGPWPLVAFLFDERFPHLTSFSVCNVFPEALEYEPFNPLECEGGSIYLEIGEVKQLQSLMNDVCKHLPDTPGPEANRNKIAFSLIDSKQQLEELHINGEIDSKSQKKYFLQTKMHAELDSNSASVVLLFIPGSVGYSARHLYFQIMDIPHRALEDPKYAPFDSSIAKIILDREGVRDLIEIFDRFTSTTNGE